MKDFFGSKFRLNFSSISVFHWKLNPRTRCCSVCLGLTEKNQRDDSFQCIFPLFYHSHHLRCGASSASARVTGPSSRLWRSPCRLHVHARSSWSHKFLTIIKSVHALSHKITECTNQTNSPLVSNRITIKTKHKWQIHPLTNRKKNASHLHLDGKW